MRFFKKNVQVYIQRYVKIKTGTIFAFMWVALVKKSNLVKERKEFVAT